jgi:hypothetical protein
MQRQGVGRPSSAAIVSLALTLSLTSCGKAPVIVSADTSCERFRHISANDEQRAAIKADWGLWETLARAIADHNDEYDSRCAPVQP